MSYFQREGSIVDKNNSNPSLQRNLLVLALLTGSFLSSLFFRFRISNFLHPSFELKTLYHPFLLPLLFLTVLPFYVL